MSFLSLLALSKVTSALLCSVRCSAMPVRKWDCCTAGRWGRRLHIQGFAAGVPASAAYPGHWSLTPGWEFACGPYAPERGDVRSPLPLGPQLPLGASPVLGCSSSVAVCSPQGSGCSPGRTPTHSRCQGTSQHPFSFLLSGPSSPRTLVASRDGQTLAAGEGGCRGCSTTWIYGALMYSSLPLAADAPCKSAPQMSRVVLRQLGLLALEDFAVASNKYTKTSAQAEQGEQ